VTGPGRENSARADLWFRLSKHHVHSSSDDLFPSCSRQRFAVLRAASCRGTVSSAPDSASTVDLVFDIASSKTCPNTDSLSFVPVHCRPWSAGGSVDAATVDLVFDIAPSTTCYRPVADNVSRFIMPLLVGEPPARSACRNYSRARLIGIALSKTGLFATQIRCPSRRFLSGHGLNWWFWTICCNRRRRLQMANSTTCFRPVSDLFPTTFRGPSCVSSVRDGSMLVIAHLI